MRPGDRVAAAVSGGADSVALLCLLLELRAELGIVLSVAHVNHKLRGEESNEDERFVATLARRHGLDLHVRKAPVDAIRNAGKSSGVEAAARELRYGFFRELARDGRVMKIATAHTLDDQAETVLLRMFRGTGMRGLAGIHPRIVFEVQGEEQGQAFGEVIRPLLGFRRAALQDFLREQDQTWREDSSNRDIAFLRNRVRHRLLPMIAEEFGQAAIEHLAELAEIARAEEEHWNRQHPEIAEPPLSPAKELPVAPFQLADNVGFVNKGLVSGYRFSDTAGPSKSDAPLGAAAPLPVDPLLALALAAQRRLVRAWLEANAPNLSVSFHLIEQALELAAEPPGRKVEMPSGWHLRRARQDLCLEFEDLNGRKLSTDYQYTLAVPGSVKVLELGASVEARFVDAVEVPENEREQLLDPRRMPKEVLIRNWRPGDRYWPAHTATEKKVKDLLSSRHATGAEKKLWPVAVAEGFGLVWMRGFAVPAAFRAPPDAGQAIWIREIAGMM
ncbi:MAG: tRNA lysidine(34) synthetase TilS [Terriglobales bacterium]